MAIIILCIVQARPWFNYYKVEKFQGIKLSSFCGF